MRRAYVFGHAFFAPRKAWQSGGRLMAGNLRGMFTEAGDVMMVTWREILFFLILFGANLIQAITGFAGTLLAMPPSMQLLGVDEAKSVLAVLDQLSCLLIVLTGFRHINWKEFGKMAVLMVIGMFAGMKIFEVFPIQQLLTLYGVMILGIALWKLFGQRLIQGRKTEPEKTSEAGLLPERNFSLRSLAMLCVILAAGVIHGMFVSGGALLVIYASSALKEKEEFRATMAMLWVTIGCYITGNQIKSGFFNSRVILLCAVGLIPLFVGIWAGTRLVKKIHQETFLKLTYVLLIISGVLAII